MRKRSSTISIGVSKVEWTVDEEGEFFAEFEGETYKHITLKGLTDKLRAIAKRKPLDIPFVQFEERWNHNEPQVRRGVVTGVHSGNRNLLVRYDNDVTDQVSRHGRDLLRGDVDTEKLQALWKAKEDARAAYEAFTREHALEIPEGKEKE